VLWSPQEPAHPSEYANCAGFTLGYSDLTPGYPVSSVRVDRVVVLLKGGKSMKYFDQYLSKQVIIELSGKIKSSGILIDYGLDILVLYNGQDFLYIPFMQMHSIKLDPSPLANLTYSGDAPINNDVDRISLRKILTNAKGMFVKIYVIGNQTLHGYVVSVLNDYFIFHSPVYKTMSISFHHLKWLIPYAQNVTPYTMNNQQISFAPLQQSTPRTYEEQIKRLEGNIVVFDIGDNPYKTGLLKKVANNMIVLITGEGEEICWNIQHLKTVHVP
jgi:hypothetical protein